MSERLPPPEHFDEVSYFIIPAGIRRPSAADCKRFDEFKLRLYNPAMTFDSKDVIAIWRVLNKETLDIKKQGEFIQHCLKRLNEDRDDSWLYEKTFTKKCK